MKLFKIDLLIINLPLFIGLLIASNTYGQTMGDDIIQLKTGEKLRGYVIEQKPGRHIRLLQRPSNDTIKINLVEIETILKIVPDQPIKETIDSSAFHSIEESMPASVIEEKKATYNQRLYYVNVEGYLGGGDWGSIGFGVSGLRTTSPRLQCGFGVRRIKHLNNKLQPDLRSTIPISIEMRYALKEMKQGKTSLMLNSSTGFHFVTSGYYYTGTIPNQSNLALMKSGFFQQVSLGFRFNVLNNLGFQFELGYQYLGSKSYQAETEEFIKDHEIQSIYFGTKFFF